MSDELRDELDEPETGDAGVDGTVDAVVGDVVNDDDFGNAAVEDANAEGETEALGALDMPSSEENVYLAFDQHWTMLFCCVAIFTACIWLPMESRRLDLYASMSVSGGFLTIFAAYGVFAQQANIKYRKMIMWPAFFMAMDGVYVGGRRAYELVTGAPEGLASQDIVRSIGPGTWVILLCSLRVIFVLLGEVAKGAKKDKARKEAARAARKR